MIPSGNIERISPLPDLRAKEKNNDTRYDDIESEIRALAVEKNIDVITAIAVYNQEKNLMMIHRRTGKRINPAAVKLFFVDYIPHETIRLMRTSVLKEEYGY